jgi:hypothetical protein
VNRLGRAIAALLGLGTAQAQEMPPAPTCQGVVGLTYSRETGVPEALGGDLNDLVWPGIHVESLSVSSSCQTSTRAIPLLSRADRITGYQYLNNLLQGGTARAGDLVTFDVREALNNLLTITGDQRALIAGTRPLMRCSLEDSHYLTGPFLILSSRDQTIAARHASLLGYRIRPGSCRNL